MIASHGITEERARAVTFTEPHYCSGSAIVSLDPAIRTAADLSGKLISVQTGTIYLDNVRKLTGVKEEVKNFPQDTDARSALVSHRVDAWVTDRFVASIAVAANPGAGMKLGDFVFIERIAAAVGKGNASPPNSTRRCGARSNRRAITKKASAPTSKSASRYSMGNSGRSPALGRWASTSWALCHERSITRSSGYVDAYVMYRFLDDMEV